MKAVFVSFGGGEDIPVLPFLKNRKMVKYLNRETMAAIVAVGKLSGSAPLPCDIPFYYATGMLEYEDYGLRDIVAASVDTAGKFSPRRFVEVGIPAVSPLNQFKVLQNMPLSFTSINFGLQGDNAVVYSSAGALLRQAACAPGGGPVLIGAGKAYRDGRVESGAAVVLGEWIEASPWAGSEAEGIEIFRPVPRGAFR